MEVGSLAQWVGILISLAGFAAGVWAALGRKTMEQILDLKKAKAEALAKVEADIASVKERMNRHEARIGSLESDFRHLPDKDIVHRIEIAIARLEGRIGQMDERLKPISAVADRWQDFMQDTHK